MTDTNGEIVATLEANFELPANTAILSGQFSVICEFIEPRFEAPGGYRFDVRLNDGEITESVVIEVVQRES